MEQHIIVLQAVQFESRSGFLFESRSVFFFQDILPYINIMYLQPSIKFYHYEKNPS